MERTSRVFITVTLAIILAMVFAPAILSQLERFRLGDDYSADHLPRLQDYLANNDLPSGRWLEENGARVCDGYMTRFADQDYCAAEVPKDWVPFRFDGQEYYIQPLTESED